MKIPRILHQIWLGPDPLPDEFAAYRETWRAHHEGWEMRLWTEESLPQELRRVEVYERLRVPAERSDILRLEVLWREGGVYLDTDFECRQPLDLLIDDLEFFVAYLKPGRVNNAFIGSTAGHPILDRAIRELRPVARYGYDKLAAGPLFLDNLVKQYPSITCFPPRLFYPSTPRERDRAVAIHHAARSWKDQSGFREAAERAAERESVVRASSERLRIERRRTEEALARARARMTEGAP